MLVTSLKEKDRMDLGWEPFLDSQVLGLKTEFYTNRKTHVEKQVTDVYHYQAKKLHSSYL